MKLSQGDQQVSRQASEQPARRAALLPRAFATKLLLSAAVCGVLTVAGPMISRTVAHAGLVSIQILLQFGGLGLTTFQVFGK